MGRDARPASTSPRSTGTWPPRRSQYIVDDCGATALVVAADATDASPRLGARRRVALRFAVGGELARFRRLRGGARRQPAAPVDDESRGQLDVLLVGHDGPAEGHQAAEHRWAARRAQRRSRRCVGGMFGVQRGLGVPVPRAAVPRRAGGLDERGAPARRHRRRRWSAFDPMRCLDADRAPPRHPRAVRADPPGPAAEAARGGAERGSTCRACRSSCTPRRRARPSEAGAIEWLRPDRARVLLGQRGRRLLRHRPRGVARPPGFGRQVAARARCTSSTTTATSCRPGEAGRSGSRRRTASSTTATRRRPPSVQRPAGWSTLGDIGCVDEEGYLLPDRPGVEHDHLGRREHLPPRDRGRADRPPRRADVAVIGVPDPEMGESVRAVVQLGRRRRRSPTRWPTSSSVLPRAARRTSSARRRSCSSTSSRGCRPARSPSACSPTRPAG